MDSHEVQDRALTPMVGTLLFYWNDVCGFQVLSDQSDLALDRSEPLTTQALAGLVQKEDELLFQAFVTKLRADLQKPDVQERQEGVARMKKRDGTYTHHSVECYLSDRPRRSVTGLIRELGAEDLYRIDLARNDTSDRNPAMFNRVAKEVIGRHPERKYALIQFDVTKFKAINAMYGEAFADELLGHFVDTLKIICDDDQLYVRLAADVFLILTPYETKEDILAFIETLEHDLQGYKGVAYRLVFGVAYIDDTAKNLRLYNDNVTLARLSIKESALEHIAFYREEMREPLESDKYVEDHMEQALADGEFVMYLQPKYSIDTGKIVGAEALARWFSKEKGMMPPMDFIPLFEKNGFVTKLDAYIWEQACKTIRGWMDAGKTCVPISVNMSRVHLKGNEYLGILDGLLKKYGIEKRLLEIELTESSGEMDVQDKIAEMKALGYTLLMDDFGSAYSSLNVLKDTQFDVLKIDHLFFRNFSNSPRGQEIIKHVIAMTKDIGLEVMAEGVKTQEQADFLLRCGCHEAQGFFYARPMPVDDFNKLL